MEGVHARYNCRCSRSSKPYAGVLGGVLLPWGKGLMLPIIVQGLAYGLLEPLDGLVKVLFGLVVEGLVHVRLLGKSHCLQFRW